MLRQIAIAEGAQEDRRPVIATEHAEEPVTARIASAHSQVRCSVRQLTAPDPELDSGLAVRTFAVAIDLRVVFWPG